MALGGVGRVFLAPIHNATPDETAGRALTELAATTLLAHGVPLAQTHRNYKDLASLGGTPDGVTVRGVDKMGVPASV